MINKITLKENPELFELVMVDPDPVDIPVKEHRRGSNFFTVWVLEIKPEWVPDNPELVGFWRTNRFVHDVENGSESGAIFELTRVLKKEVEKTIIVKEWIEVTP